LGRPDEAASSGLWKEGARIPAPQRAGSAATSLRQGSQKPMACRRRNRLQIEQCQEIDGAELAVPSRRRRNSRAYRQVRLQKLGDFDRILWMSSHLLRLWQLCAVAFLLAGTRILRGRHRLKLRRNP